jgi:uncharacterized protein DUF6084
VTSVALPAPEFAVAGVEADPHAATPVLRFEVGVTDASGRDVYTMAVSAQVHVDAHRRPYDEATRERLRDLFGEGDGVPATAGSLRLGRVDTLVPSFTGSGSFTVELPVSGDLELAGTRYFASLPGGNVPLTFNFNGSVFYRGDDDRMQVTLVPWTASARYRMPAATWHELIERRHAGSGFVRLQAGTLESLRRRRAERGLPTFDATIAAALEESG